MWDVKRPDKTVVLVIARLLKLSQDNKELVGGNGNSLKTEDKYFLQFCYNLKFLDMVVAVLTCNSQ